jgi:hypothetical protein
MSRVNPGGRPRAARASPRVAQPRPWKRLISLDSSTRFGYLVRVKYFLACLTLVLAATLIPSPVSGQADRLVLFGDIVYFYPPGHAKNCLLNNQFKRGEPVGFRMNAINPATGKRDRATQLVVHLSYAGKTVDVPMRDRQNEKQPEREFWVAKWAVPDDAPMGIVRYTVTAKDSQGRMGEFKPFDVQPSKITVVP